MRLNCPLRRLCQIYTPQQCTRVNVFTPLIPLVIIIFISINLIREVIATSIYVPLLMCQALFQLYDMNLLPTYDNPITFILQMRKMRQQPSQAESRDWAITDFMLLPFNIESNIYLITLEVDFFFTYFCFILLLTRIPCLRGEWGILRCLSFS